MQHYCLEFQKDNVICHIRKDFRQWNFCNGLATKSSGKYLGISRVKIYLGSWQDLANPGSKKYKHLFDIEFCVVL